MELSFFIKAVLILAAAAVLFVIQNITLKIYEKECLKLWKKNQDKDTPRSCWLKIKRFALALTAVLLIGGIAALLGYYLGTQNFFQLP